MKNDEQKQEEFLQELVKLQESGVRIFDEDVTQDDMRDYVKRQWDKMRDVFAAFPDQNAA